MNDKLFNRQFLITKKECSLENWKKFSVEDFNLYVHPNLDYTFSQREARFVAVLGYLFDYRKPESTNQEIVNKLAGLATFNELLEELKNFAGQFIVINRDADGIKIVPDACAQRELLYTETYDTFASQAKLMELVQSYEVNEDTDILELFNSDSYQNKLFVVSSSTDLKGVYRLLINHYLDLSRKEMKRYFPAERIEYRPLNQVVDAAAEILKGYLKAITCRYPKVAIPVTGGFDSRVIFAASLGLDCRYFIYQHGCLNENHPDIIISKKLTGFFGKKLEILTHADELEGTASRNYKDSLDFPRHRDIAMILNGNARYFHDSIILTGQLGEIARRFYNYSDQASPQEMCSLLGIEGKGTTYVKRVLKEWLTKNKDLFTRNNLSVMDMFFWEVDTPSAAKSKSECGMVSEVFSPFNSLILLTTLLSASPKYRDKYFCPLYKALVNKLAGCDVNIPVNPSRKKKIIKMMKYIGVYNLYVKFKYSFF